MRNFLQNLSLLVVLGIVLFIIAPDLMKQILGIYNGLGMLPIVVLLVIVAGLPRRSRRQRK